MSETSTPGDGAPTTPGLSFGRNVADYERGRPGYPDAAVDWMLARITRDPAHSDADPSTLHAVDVGAGTGKFTVSLVARGLQVTAVEPDALMRGALSSSLPTVTALEGAAEEIPLPADSADLVSFAQSWHWVDVPRASAEVTRILKTGGALSLVWNIRDESVDWVARLGEVIGSSAAEQYDSIEPPVGEPLERTEHAEFAWLNPLTREQLFAMVTSRSYVMAMRPDERTSMLRMLDSLLSEHPQLTGLMSYAMPYVTRVTLARVQSNSQSQSQSQSNSRLRSQSNSRLQSQSR